MTTLLVIILDFMANAFVHIWPYLLITIPLAVAVNMSGASKHIKRAFDAGPIAAILLATIVGAFSPFCSCGVIPVIAALLIGGVPLAPVMAFWVASPSMDPEIFFLSVATIGWDLAVWRLAGTLVLSLSAGFITYFLIKTGWISSDVLKNSTGSGQTKLRQLRDKVVSNVKSIFTGQKSAPLVPVGALACCADDSAQPGPFATAITHPAKGTAKETDSCGCENQQLFLKRLGKESLDATLMVVKFMALAFFLEALIILYVPQVWITGIMGKENSWAILTAAFLGVPVYTGTLSALPMVKGLLVQGMSPAAALAFLVAGPTTTLPAMAAVWTLVKPRIFMLYVSFSLLGAIILGYLKQIF